MRVVVRGLASEHGQRVTENLWGLDHCREERRDERLIIRAAQLFCFLSPVDCRPRLLTGESGGFDGAQPWAKPRWRLACLSIATLLFGSRRVQVLLPTHAYGLSCSFCNSLLPILYALADSSNCLRQVNVGALPDQRPSIKSFAIVASPDQVDKTAAHQTWRL